MFPMMLRRAPYSCSKFLAQRTPDQSFRERAGEGSAPVLAELEELLLRQAHERVDLVLRALEVVDGERIRGDAADVEQETDLEHLFARTQSSVDGARTGDTAREEERRGAETHPPQSDEAVRVPLLHAQVVHAGVAPVPVHDEGDVARDGACGEDAQEGVACRCGRPVAQPARAPAEGVQDHRRSFAAVASPRHVDGRTAARSPFRANLLVSAR